MTDDGPREGIRKLSVAPPTVRVIPPVNQLVQDIRALVKTGLDQLKGKAASGAFTPMDGRVLESLARSAKLAADMAKSVREGLGPKLDKLDQAELDAIMQDPAALRALLDEDEV